MAVSTIQTNNSASSSSVSKAISSGTLDNYQCHKVGNVVNVSGRLHSMTVPASGTFFTVPEGYRPRILSRGTGYMYTSDGKMYPCLATVYPAGNVDLIVSQNLTATQVGFTATYSI